MQVAKISEEQKNLLLGQTWDGITFFNPTLDSNNNWFVSIQEVDGCVKPEFQWLKYCEFIDISKL